MTFHKATCQDCPESYTDPDLGKVSEWAEDHQRSEIHEVNIERAVATDGGRDQDQYFLVDEARSAVVDGPYTDREAAVAAAAERAGSVTVATRDALDLVEATSDTTIRWETDDVDVVTDGGHIPGHQPGGPPPVERGRDWVCPGCDQAYHGRPDVVDDAGARWRCYCSIGCYIEDLQFLGAELHKCDLCDQVFDDVDALAAHDCDPSVERLFPDGGSEMYWDDEHCPRADCEGQLQHQDQVEIMCLACEETWSAAILRGEHVLIDSDGERVSFAESRGGRHE